MGTTFSIIEVDKCELTTILSLIEESKCSVVGKIYRNKYNKGVFYEYEPNICSEDYELELEVVAPSENHKGYFNYLFNCRKNIEEGLLNCLAKTI